MDFEILGEIEQVETFASGRGIRELARLNRIYGRGNWRKRKGREVGLGFYARHPKPHPKGLLPAGTFIFYRPRTAVLK